MKYRKKPVVIEAVQLLKAGEEPTAAWMESFHAFMEKCADWSSDRDEGIAIRTLEGTMRADPGDWIIRGVKGEYYPCKPDIFAATYEAVEP